MILRSLKEQQKLNRSPNHNPNTNLTLTLTVTNPNHINYAYLKSY